MRQIVLDTETTGLSPAEGHKIIEIGCIELVNRRFTGNKFHQYINPSREIDADAIAVHGITNEYLRDKPAFAVIANAFIDFVKDAELIIHNAPFDTGFLNHELASTKQGWKPITTYCHVIDTLVMARQLHVGQRNGLDALCKRYSVDNSQREYHGALLDAHLLAQVYLAMTGGQGSLFDAGDSKEAHAAQQHHEQKIERIARNLTVLSATEDELKDHEAKLASMKAKGNCIWID